MFGSEAGKQCTCNSLMFLIYTTNTALTSKVLDQVLTDGMSLYHRIGVYDYLLISQLPTHLKLNRDTFTVSYFESITGDILNDTSLPGSPFHTINDALSISLDASQHILLSVGHTPASTTAIYKTSDHIFVFDPHSRTKHGMISINGTAVLLKFRNVQSLVIYLKRYAHSFASKQNICSFEVTPIEITKHANIHVQSCTIKIQGNMKPMIGKQYQENHQPTNMTQCEINTSKHACSIPRQTQEYREKHREEMKRHRSCPDKRTAEARQKKGLRQKDTYKEHHQTVMKTRRSSSKNKTIERTAQKRKYASSTDYRNQKRKKTPDTTEHLVQSFQTKCQEMPVYECTVCSRVLFLHQVSKLRKEVLTTDNDFASEVVNNTDQTTLWICKTCKRYRSKGKLAPQAVKNNLELDPLSETFRSLNNLERHLISPVIPFMKIFPLPKSLMKGIHGPCICVPSNVSHVTQTQTQTKCR